MSPVHIYHKCNDRPNLHQEKICPLLDVHVVCLIYLNVLMIVIQYIDDSTWSIAIYRKKRKRRRKEGGGGRSPYFLCCLLVMVVLKWVDFANREHTWLSQKNNSHDHSWREGEGAIISRMLLSFPTGSGQPPQQRWKCNPEKVLFWKFL